MAPPDRWGGRDRQAGDWSAKRSGRGDGEEWTGEPPTLDEINKKVEKRLCVSHLPPGTNQDELTAIYGHFGTITECRVLGLKNCAFLQFETWAACHRALLETDGIQHLSGHAEDETVRAHFAERTGTGSDKRFSKGLPHTKLFISGLPEACTKDDIWELVSDFGEVLEMSLLAPKARHRCGFVSFSIWGEALDATEALNQRPYPGGGGAILKVVFARAEERRERRDAVDRRDGGDRKDVGDRRDAGDRRAVGDRRDSGDRKDGGRGQYEDGGDHAKRRRVDGAGDRDRGHGASAGWNDPFGFDATEFERLKEEYMAALEDGRARQTCNLLHEQLMDLKDLLDGRRSSAMHPPRPPSPERRVPTPPERRPPTPPERKPPTPPERRPPPPAEGSNSGGASRARSSATAGRGGSNISEARIFIGGLPMDCDDEDLRQLVDQLPLRTGGAGRRLVECSVRAGRGCGYLSFASSSAACEAIEELHERQVKGWAEHLRARWATPKAGDQSSVGGSTASAPWRGGGGAAAGRSSQTSEAAASEAVTEGRRSTQTSEAAASKAVTEGRRLFVGQLQPLSTKEVEDRLWKIVKGYGVIEDLRYVDHKNVAYITFQRQRDAKRAQEEMDRQFFKGISRDDGLSVQFARKKL